jgi:hypothetical protein
MSQTASWNDSYTSLWRKISQNYYAMAVARGYVGTLEPNALDSEISAMRKVCFYTAFIVSALVIVQGLFLRPDGASGYLRPDGTSTYLRS